MKPTSWLVAAALAACAFDAHAQSVTTFTPPSENLSRLQTRVDELEGLLRQQTAENERLAIELDRTQKDNERLQKLLDDALGQARPPAVAPPPPAPPPTTASETPPAPAPPQATTTPADAYKAAQALLLRSQFAEAERAFAGFLANHPDAAEAPDAQYWLGRTQIVTGSYGEAAGQFVAMLRRWPESPLAADAWVRLGVALRGMGQIPQACETLRDLPRRFPAASAQTRALAATHLREANCPLPARGTNR